MKEIVKNSGLVAYCGLYCGACRRYLADKCPGCRENVKATWCKLRSCCIDNHYKSCADCMEYPDPMGCSKFNNLISKIFAFLFRSNRKACIEQIRAKGIDGHAEVMTGMKRHSLRKPDVDSLFKTKRNKHDI